MSLRQLLPAALIAWDVLSATLATRIGMALCSAERPTSEVHAAGPDPAGQPPRLRLPSPRPALRAATQLA